MSRTSPRSVAYELLRAVDEHDAYANLAMPALLARAKLDARDAGFATELGYGTLRLRGRYDAILPFVLTRPLTKLDPPVRRVLQLGAHQLFAMRVEPHAAVSQSVSLAKSLGVASAAGFVNSVLRRLSEKPLAHWLELVSAAQPERVSRLAAMHSHPDWIVRALEGALGQTGAADELESLLSADNEAPAVSLVALPGIGPTPSPGPGDVSPLAVTHPGGAVSALEEQGLRVQDQGSQLAALTLSRYRAVSPGERWLDVCAGPGGKAALLAAEARAGGAVLQANEPSAHRAQLVRAALASVDSAISVSEHDGRELDGRFERILLDAPCSGLGALRRRPEARWRKSEAELRELTHLQTQLLRHSLTLLAPGGVLCYVTCSPDVRETRDVLDRVVPGRSDVRLIDTAPVLDRIAPRSLDAASGSAAQLWPHRHGTDAMFIQLIEKVGSPHGAH